MAFTAPISTKRKINQQHSAGIFYTEFHTIDQEIKEMCVSSSFTSLHQARLSLSQFSRNSRSQHNVVFKKFLQWFPQTFNRWYNCWYVTDGQTRSPHEDYFPFSSQRNVYDQSGNTVHSKNRLVFHDSYKTQKCVLWTEWTYIGRIPERWTWRYSTPQLY